MIPKIIHYCWFGKKEKPELARRCIASWEKYLPDYKMQEWNEDTFAIARAPKFVREAYKIGKYAFVADYVRLYALYTIGGIYFDTDVEVIKDFDNFLSHKSFIGYEDHRDKYCIMTGVIGSIPRNSIIKKWLDYYEDKSFILPNNEYNDTPNVDIITADLVERGLVLGDEYVVLEDNIHIYPKDYFCPKDPDDNLHITKNTACIHYYSGSWCFFIPYHHRWLVNIIGGKNYFRLGRLKKFLFGKNK